MYIHSHLGISMFIISRTHFSPERKYLYTYAVLCSELIECESENRDI